MVDRFVVRYLGGNSSSKSSELGTGGGLSAVTGSGGGSAAESGAEESTRCFVLGGGASTGRALCLERTGTGVVVRVVALGYSGPGAHHPWGFSGWCGGWVAEESISPLRCDGDRDLSLVQG